MADGPSTSSIERAPVAVPKFAEAVKAEHEQLKQKEHEPNILDKAADFTKRGVEKVLKEFEEGGLLKKAAIVAGTIGLASLAYGLIKEMAKGVSTAFNKVMDAGDWLTEKLLGSKDKAIRSILKIAFGASAAGLVYEAIKGKVSFVELSAAYSKNGITGVASFLFAKQKAGIIDIGSDTLGGIKKMLGIKGAEKKEGSEEGKEIFGEMIPISEAYPSYAKEMNDFMVDVADWMLIHKYELISAGIVASQIDIIRNSVIGGVRLTKDILLTLAKLPLAVMKTFPFSSFFMIGAVFMFRKEVKSFVDIKVPKDPATLKRFIEYELRQSADFLEDASIQNIPAEHIDQTISVMKGETSFQQLKTWLKEATVTGAVGVLEKITTTPERLLQERNRDGVQSFQFSLAKVRTENPEAQAALKALLDYSNQVEDALKKGEKLTKQQVDELIRLSPAAGVQMFRESGLIRYYSVELGPRGIKNFGIDPEASNTEWLAKSFVIQDDLITSASQVYKMPLQELRMIAGGVLFKDVKSEEEAQTALKDRMKSGGMIVVSSLGVMLVEPTKGAYQKYFLGPLRLVKHLIPFGDDFSMKEAATDYGEGLLPVFCLGLSQHLFTEGLTKAGLGKVLIETVTYPYQGLKATSKFINQNIWQVLKLEDLKSPLGALAKAAEDPALKIKSNAMARIFEIKNKVDWFRKMSYSAENLQTLRSTQHQLAKLYQAKAILHEAKRASGIKEQQVLLDKLSEAVGSSGYDLSGSTPDKGYFSKTLEEVNEEISKRSQVLSEIEKKASLWKKAAFGIRQVHELAELKDEVKIFSYLTKRGVNPEQAARLVDDLLKASKSEEVAEILNKGLPEMTSPNLWLKIKGIRTGMLGLSVVGTVVSGYEAMTAFWEAGTTKDSDRSSIQKKKGFLWTANFIVDAAATYGSGAALVGAEAGAAGTIGAFGLPLIPVMAVGTNVFESLYERTITVEEWYKKGGRDQLMHEWIASITLADSAGEKFRSVIQDRDKIAKEKSETARKIMFSILLKEEFKPADAQPDQYRVQFLDTILESSVPRTVGAADELLRISQRYSEIMRTREIKVRSGLNEYVIDGLNLLDKKYDHPDLDGMGEILRAYENYCTNEIQPDLKMNFDQFSDEYLVDLYCRSNFSVNSKRGVMEDKDTVFKDQLRNYLVYVRKIRIDQRVAFWIAKIEKKKMSFEEAYEMMVQTKTQIGTFLEKPTEEMKKDIQPKNNYENALYTLAKSLGYQGYPREEDLRKFFGSDQKGRYGVYWDGDEWLMNDNYGLDEDMGDELTEKTIQNMISEFRNDWGDIYETRNQSLYDTVTASREAMKDQALFTARMLEQGMNAKLPTHTKLKPVQIKVPELPA